MGDAETVFVPAETGVGGAAVVAFFFDVLQATISKAETIIRVFFVILFLFRLNTTGNVVI